MDRNLLWAVALSLGVYAIWFGLIEKRIIPQQPPPRPGAASQTLPGTPAPAPQASEAAAPQITTEEALAKAESETFGKAQALISPRGAAIVSWKDQEPLGIVQLVEEPNPGLLATSPELTFQKDGDREWTAQRADGAVMTKEFVPGTDDVLPRLKITVSNPTSKPLDAGGWTLSFGTGLGTIASEQNENKKVWRAIGLTAPAGGLEGKVEKFKPGAHGGDYRWVGIDNRYFLAAALPKAGDFARVDSGMPPAVTLTAKSVTLAPKESHEWEVPFYVGAKGHNWLAHYGVGLERAIDFGFFAQLGRFVLKVLGRLHEATGNWGWSIILLTMLIQAVLFPLTFKSLKSMAAMRRLQPEIARLQQRYAKDQTRLSQETMELYRKNGANPLGGCLPMLVQMPIFYALYAALRNAWELHGAGWIFWIKDLSAKDPFYVLPLIMGGVMFLQNKLNAQQTADPAQAQMMTWMPVIFTFMFLRFPSGLVLYWLTNSLVSTTQQLALKKYLDQPTR